MALWPAHTAKITARFGRARAAGLQHPRPPDRCRVLLKVGSHGLVFASAVGTLLIGPTFVVSSARPFGCTRS
jgi:hypothetical protein